MIASPNQPVRPSVYQFSLGAAVITMILEGYLHRDDMHPFVATNARSEEVESLAARYRLPFPKMEHNFVAMLLETPDKLIAVDPGFGENAPAATAGFFSTALGVAGYASTDVDIVLISHCHPDHIGNLMTAGEPTFSNAEVVFGRTEFDYWKRGENISEMRQHTLSLFQKVALPLAERSRFIEPGDEIAPGLTGIEAFGHSAGHMCFHFESQGEALLMLNDAVPHYVASFARPDWHFLMDDDPDAAAISRRRMLEMAASEAMAVTGFHIPFPSLGFVEKKESGFEFRAASYQFNLGANK